MPLTEILRRKLLAVTSYRGSDAATALTAGANFVDVDAANLVITFTAPQSGSVLVKMTAYAVSITQSFYFNLRDGSGDVANTSMFMSAPLGDKRVHYACLVSGLNPGQSYTWKWGARVHTGGTGSLYSGPVQGPAVMEVWAA